MMIGVPYNPIIGEMSVDGGDDGRAAAPGFTWGCGPARRSKCTRPDPAGEADMHPTRPRGGSGYIFIVFRAVPHRNVRAKPHSLLPARHCRFIRA